MADDYLHGDLVPQRPADVVIGIDARWFYDARLDALVVVSPVTVRPYLGDVQWLSAQLKRAARNRQAVFRFRNRDENVFISNPLVGAPKSVTMRRALQFLELTDEEERSGLAVREKENERLSSALCSTQTISASSRRVNGCRVAPLAGNTIDLDSIYGTCPKSRRRR